MSTRIAESRWEGNLPGGKGRMKVGSGALDVPYSFSSRFEEGPGSNPEELVGAALSGCFSMFLSNVLSQDGHEPTSITTEAKVHLGQVEGAPKITRIELDCEGVVPGIGEDLFMEKAELSKKQCPVSQALAGTEVVLHAHLKA